MEVEKSDLENLKIEYSKFQKQHNLPSFDELNRDFKIEKIDDGETDFLIRDVRYQIGDFLEGFLRLLEAFLNPINVPMYFFPIVKALDEEDKKILTEMHEKVSKLMIKSIKLIDYSEKGEVEFIKDSFNLWQITKENFTMLIENIEKKIDNKTKKSERGYFG